jgi:branched-chain amino acid transport system substrate-binding protein
VRDQIKFFDSIGEQTGKKPKRLAMLYENGPYGSSTAENLRKYAKEADYEIVVDESFKAGSPDLNPLMSKAKAANPDIIVSYGYTIDSVLMLRTMETLTIKAGFFGVGSSVVDDSVLKLGSLSEGAFGICNWWGDLKKEGAAELNDRYKKKYGRDLVGYAANSYAMLWVFKDAVEKAHSTDPQKITDALHSIRITKGPAMVLNDNEIYFGPSGQNEISLVGIQIQDDKYTTVWPTELGASKFRPW